VVLHGWITRLFASPTLASSEKSAVLATKAFAAISPPRTPNVSTPPNPPCSTRDAVACDGCVGSPGYDTHDTAGCDDRKRATASALVLCCRMRSGSVSSPCRNRNALKGDSAAPTSRSRTAYDTFAPSMLPNAVPNTTP